MSQIELGQSQQIEPYNSDVIRKTTDNGQVVWFKSSPEEKERTDETTSAQESQSPEV